MALELNHAKDFKSATTRVRQPDYTLVLSIRNGDQQSMEVLLVRFTPLIRKIVSQYYAHGHGYEDLMQEARIGLYYAVRRYKPEKKVSFRIFAGQCIRSSVLNLVTASNRLKRAIHKNTVSLSSRAFRNGGDEDEYITVLEDVSALKPEDWFIEKESYHSFISHIEARLSKLEYSVLVLYLKEQTLRQISENLGVGYKTVDNAIQRIREKLKDRLN